MKNITKYFTSLFLTVFLIMTGAAQEKSFKISELRTQCDVLLKQKKQKDFECLVTKAINSGNLQEEECRELMNRWAGSLYWTNRYRKSLELLQAATRLKAEKHGNVYYQTYGMMAGLWNQRLGKPEAAITILDDILNVQGIHPANRYSGYMTQGAAYEKLGMLEKALECYKQALVFGKKITYKTSYAGAEKKIRELTDKLKNSSR